MRASIFDVAPDLMPLWRISNHSELEGPGGEKADGRWHTAARGKRIVYFSEHPALALLEVLANLKVNPQLFPVSYQLMKIGVADNVQAETLDPGTLSNEWRENIRETQSVGDEWLAAGRFALLAVHSAPSPESLNYLFNPLHREAKNIAVEWTRRIAYDQRLFRTMQTKIK
jgi:RES domain-containing protein